MKSLTKFLLAVAVTGLVAGTLFLTDVINVSEVPELYVILPLGAIGYGMFLICYMLQKETARFDKEQRARPASEVQPRRTEAGHGQDHTAMAHSH